MILTEGERALLTAIRDSEFHDGRPPVDDAVWVDCTSGRLGKSARGYMASCVKKGLAWTDGEVCSITQAGFDALKVTP